MTSERSVSPCKNGVLFSDIHALTHAVTRNPDERPTAMELRKHKYLELTPGWVFSGFK